MYETYPYKAQVPVKIDGKYKSLVFESEKDVWKVVDLIIKDTEELNESTVENFDICDSVYSQISFFACKNILHNADIQKDIKRYLYCEKFNVSPHDGDFGKQPSLWVDKSFLIRKYLAKVESKQISKAKEDGTRKN